MTSRRPLVPFVCFAGTLLGATVACGIIRSPRPATIDSASADSVSRFVELEVTNHNWSDIVVYVVHGGIRTRLGIVQTAKSLDLRFPFSYAYARSITLLATPIGSNARYESEAFVIQPGQRVFWTLENSLARSSLMIR